MGGPVLPKTPTTIWLPNLHLANTSYRQDLHTPLAMPRCPPLHAQALLSSMLPLDLLEMASAAATSEDPLARNWLPKLLHWFHRTFTLSTSPAHTAQQQQDTAAAAAGPSSSKGTSSSSRMRWGQGRDSEVFLQELLGLSGQSVQQQLLGCVQRRRGDATQLAVLLVALLRAVGFLTRSVW